MAWQELPGERRGNTSTQTEMAAAGSPLAVEEEDLLSAAPAGSPLRDAWRRFIRNRAALGSLVVLIMLCILAVFAPYLHTTDPLAQNYSTLNAGPSPRHWFGTDALGRDQYSRLLYGLRAPLLAAIVGAAITAFLGALFGLIAGYYGGVMDAILARFTDAMFAFPGFTLALIVVSLYGNALDPYFGGGGRLMILIIVFAVVGWPGLMRFVRSLALSLKKQQFIEAARVAGSSDRKIIIRHVLPNVFGLMLVQVSFIMTYFVYTEAVLSIFGLGVEPPNPDLGQMLSDGASNMGTNYWEVLFPSLFLTILILAFTFLGDGVRDAVDPRMNK